VLAAVAPARRARVDANVTAGTELRLLTKPRPALPDSWRIVAPPPAAELLAAYHDAEAATGVPWAYLAAVHLVETRMGRIRGTSTAGAQGPMQFLPSTWSRYGNGGDINNPHDAIAAAARLLKADGAPANMANALFSYNHSDHYVRAVTLYAQQMQADARAYDAYYYWLVYYRLMTGDIVLEEGYGT
jgi:membrane-bound lytic murein transglycosylase B